MVSLASGQVYRIVNVKTGKVLDLSNDHKRSIVGNDFKDGDNQLWCLKRFGPTWSIQAKGIPYCLGLESEPEYHDPVIATCYHSDQYHWSITPADDHDHSIFRIIFSPSSCPQTTYHIELTWQGNDPNAAQVRPAILQRRFKDGAQLWRFELVSSM